MNDGDSPEGSDSGDLFDLSGFKGGEGPKEKKPPVKSARPAAKSGDKPGYTKIPQGRKPGGFAARDRDERPSGPRSAGAARGPGAARGAGEGKPWEKKTWGDRKPWDKDKSGSRGADRGPGASRGPGAGRGPDRGPGAYRGADRGPGASRGPDRGPGADRGSGRYQDRGERRPAYGDRPGYGASGPRADRAGGPPPDRAPPARFPRHFRKPEIAAPERSPLSSEAKEFLPLKTDKGRYKESRFLLEGSKNIADALAVSPAIIHAVLVTAEFKDKDLLALVKKNRISLVTLSLDDIKTLSDTETPQGIMAVANFATLKPDWNLIRHVTLLDAVQDPGNVGAIFRTSLALGMDAIVAGKGTCDPYNAKVVRSSVGALLRLPFETGEELGSKIAFLRQKGFSIVATSSHAKITLDQAKLRKKVAVIVGNEGAGTGASYLDMADAVVKIPIKNKVESLNVSVAHGILAYQLLQGRT